MARKLPVGVRQPSLGDDLVEVRREADEELRQYRHDLLRPYELLDPEVQAALVPQVLGEWMRWGHLFACDPDLEDRIWKPFVKDVAGRIEASVMDGPYWPRLIVRGRGMELRRMVFVPWSAELDHVTRYRGFYFNHELHVHVALPSRLRIEATPVQEALKAFLDERWGAGEARMASALHDAVDADYIATQLDGVRIFNESGEIVA